LSTVNAGAARLHQLTLRRQELLDRLHDVSSPMPIQQHFIRGFF